MPRTPPYFGVPTTRTFPGQAVLKSDKWRSSSKYFPELDEQQQRQFRNWGELYKRLEPEDQRDLLKDIDNLYAHHILHSLGIARVIRFIPGAGDPDLGTGGVCSAFHSPSFFPKPGLPSSTAPAKRSW